MNSDTKELAIRPVDNLIAQAVEKDLDVDKLERLIEMRNKELSRQAKLDYDEHFALMQLEYVPVGKGKSAMDRDGKKTLYKYCPLEDILAVYQPIISKHGFSYRWSEETISPTEKRMWCIVAGYGHEERSYVDIPIQPPQGYTNVVQQRGSATTYGKRYSFIDAFGVIIGGEDDDATGSAPTTQSRPAPYAPANTSPYSPDEYDARLDHAVKSGKLTEAAADTWRDRLAKPASRKAAEDWIKANTDAVPAPMSAGKAAAVEAEIVDESLDAAADAGFGPEPPQDGLF